MKNKIKMGKLLEERVRNIKNKLERSGKPNEIGGNYLNIISTELEEFEATKRWAAMFGFGVLSYQEKVNQILSPYEQYCK